VALHPQIGIAVFEVKDWNLDAMDYFTERDKSGRLVLKCKDRYGTFQFATKQRGDRFVEILTFLTSTTGVSGYVSEQVIVENTGISGSNREAQTQAGGVVSWTTTYPN